MKKFFGRSVALQRSKLIDAFFGAGFLAGEQIFGGAVSFRVPDFGVALILSFGEVSVMEFVVELFDFFKSVGQTFLTLGLQSRADAVITISINVLLDTFRVDMLAVGNFKTAAIVSGQFQRPSLLSGGHAESAVRGVGATRCSEAANLPPAMRQIIPSRI